jgi:hypothetical protein
LGSGHCQRPGLSSPLLSRLHSSHGILTRGPHAVHRGRCTQAPRGIFDAFQGKNNAEEEWEGPTFEAIDPESDGGLGGTSEELFGPLVSSSTYSNNARNKYPRMDLQAADWQGHLHCALQAVLLVGYAQYEVDQFRAFMIDMDADIVKVRLQLIISGLCINAGLPAIQLLGECM